MGQGVAAAAGLEPVLCGSGGRMWMERSQVAASRGQCSSGESMGFIPKPWPPVA